MQTSPAPPPEQQQKSNKAQQVPKQDKQDVCQFHYFFVVMTLSNFQSEIDNLVSKLLNFKTFDNFLRVLASVLEKLASKKMYQFQFRKIWSRKKVSVSVSKNLVSEKSLGFGFGKFAMGKKVSVMVSVKILVLTFSASNTTPKPNDS